MASALDLFGLGSDTARVGAGILLLQGGTYAMDACGAVNSSPWTAENFGGDPAKAASCREYVMHAAAVSIAYCAAASLLAQSPWPLVGAAIQMAYLWWIYNRALARATSSGSTGF